MTHFVQALVSAISLGSIYSLLAIALVVVYRANRTLNFAQGEIGTFTTFIAFSLINHGWALGLAAVASVAIGFALCAAVYYFLVRPLRHRPGWAVVLIGAGLYLGVNALSGTIWGANPHGFPSIFPNAVGDYFTIAGARVYYYVVGDLAALIVLTCVVSLLIGKTSIGLQMRAVAANPQSADLLGISTARVVGLVGTSGCPRLDRGIADSSSHDVVDPDDARRPVVRARRGHARRSGQFEGRRDWRDRRRCDDDDVVGLRVMDRSGTQGGGRHGSHRHSPSGEAEWAIRHRAGAACLAPEAASSRRRAGEFHGRCPRRYWG